MNIKERFLQMKAELEASGKKVWAVEATGEPNLTHGAQPWPYMAAPFGTGISEPPMFYILVEASSCVGDTFLRRHDETRWTVRFSEVEAGTAYWLAVEAEPEAIPTTTSVSSHELAVIATTINLGPEVAKLLG